MLYDFDSPQCPLPSHSGVIVIGAGAAGILLATQLAAAGRSVTLLEGGGRLLEPRSQEIYRSQLTGLPYRGIHEGRFRTYGGTTTRWGGQILELDPGDFETRPHIEGSGWPFPKSTLAAFYQRALRFEGLRRVEQDDDAVWHSLNLDSRGRDAFSLSPEFAMLYSRWCPERNFAELHARALTDTRKLAVLLHANVTGFMLNSASSAIQSVTVRGFSGRTATLTAGRFVLCMGGIETTRLLLQPLAEGVPPWQSNGFLGRFYQDHIGLNRIPIHQLASQPAYQYFGYADVRGFRYHNKIQLAPAQQAQHGTLNVAGTIGPWTEEHPARDNALATLRQVVRDRKRPLPTEALSLAIHTPAIAARMLSRRYRGEAPLWGRTMLTVHSEQEPLSSSVITLSGERDEFGLLRTQLQWNVSPLELHTIRTYVRLAQSVFARTGFARIEPPAGFFDDDALVRSMCGDSNHHMGGTRMSTLPSAGIVDPNLQIHGIANAYICSSSVFPSSGFSNPTHTILALAMRLCDRIVNQTLPSLIQFNQTQSYEPSPTLPSMRHVTLPGTTQTVPQLAFGCSYLLGPGLDRAASLRLLDAAYDAGIRHFDVARLYGQGHTEALLGEFLRLHPDATVTTKYGVIPPTPSRRVAMAAARRIPSIAPFERRFFPQEEARFDAAQASEALDLSLRLLGRDRVELFLLHEPTPVALRHDDLLAFLERQRASGRIGNFGIGGEWSRAVALFEQHSAYTPVLQFEHSIFGPRLDLPGVGRIHYRTFARPAAALTSRFDRDPALLHLWSESVDAELAEPRVLARLLLKAALDEFPASLMLFSTRSEEHIFDNVEVAANQTLEAPARRLLDLVRQDDLGIGAELYPAPPEPPERHAR